MRSSIKLGEVLASEYEARMKICSRTGAYVSAVILCLGIGSSAQTQSDSRAPSALQKRVAMTTHANGTFEVKLTPQAPDDKAGGATLSRMSIEKKFQGDLQGTSKGEMLSAVTGVKGSAGYVAIERVSGTLQGRSGTFVLQHSGTMTRGAQQLTIAVVPDSGTGQLVGLAGAMTIKIADGKHSYDLEYTLVQTP